MSSEFNLVQGGSDFCSLPSEYVLFKVGLSCPKWVCPVQNGSVLSKVGLSSPKMGLSCLRLVWSLLSGSVLSKVVQRY